MENKTKNKRTTTTKKNNPKVQNTGWSQTNIKYTKGQGKHNKCSADKN